MKQMDVLSRRHEHTGAWFLESSEFQSWMNGSPGRLWCPGIPGAGKTVLASILVEYLKTIYQNGNAAVLCVFCNHADQEQQNCIDLVTSLLAQLMRTKGVTKELRVLYQSHLAFATRPGLKEISGLLQSVIQNFARVFIVIDALDESPETTRDSFVGEIEKLRTFSHLLVTSREGSPLPTTLHDAIHLNIHASDTDLESFIRSKT